MFSCTHLYTAFYRVRTRPIALAWWGEQAFGRLSGRRHSRLFDLSVEYRFIHSLYAEDRDDHLDITLQGSIFTVST